MIRLPYYLGELNKDPNLEKYPLLFVGSRPNPAQREVTAERSISPFIQRACDAGPQSPQLKAHASDIPEQLLPIGSKVVPFCGSYLGSYKVIPKRNYLGAYG